MKTSWISTMTLVGGFVFAVATNAAPVTIAHWSGDYGSTGSNTDPNNGTVTAFQLNIPDDPTGMYGGFNDNTPISPTNASYTAPADRNETFYGGIGLYGVGTARNIDTNRVQESNNYDNIYLQATGTDGTDAATSLVGVYIVKKEDFLNGADALTVSLDNDSEFRAIFTSDFNANSREYRFVVQQAGQYYISSSTAGDNSNDSGYTVPGDADQVAFNSLTWEEYDPNTSLLYTSGTAFNGTFSDVTAFGIYAQSDRTLGNAFGLRNNVVLFAADATAVPEPASLALMGLGGLLMLSRRRQA